MRSDIVGTGSEKGNCVGAGCRQKNPILAFIMGVLTLIFLIGVLVVLCCFIQYKRTRARSKPRKTDEEIPAAIPIPEHESLLTGNWSSRYYRNGDWHGPHPISLTFDRTLQSVQGYGTNDLGAYTVHGTVTPTESLMTLTLSYDAYNNTPMPDPNNSVLIKLAWNAISEQYEGNWTLGGFGEQQENPFELRFDRVPATSDE